MFYKLAGYGLVWQRRNFGEAAGVGEEVAFGLLQLPKLVKGLP
jgi:hypothetical protein